MTFPGFRLILGEQKSSKMMTFSKHEKHEQIMLYAANLRLGGVQKSIKNESNKKQKKMKIKTPEKTPKWRGPGGHNTDWVTHVWPKGSLGTNNFKRFQHNNAQGWLSHNASGLKPGEFKSLVRRCTSRRREN